MVMSMSSLLLVLSSTATVLSASVQQPLTEAALNNDIASVTFKSWCTVFDACDNVDNDARQQTFQENQALILAHNVRESAGEETYKMGLNQFSDLSPSQFAKKWLSPMNRTTLRNERRLPEIVTMNRNGTNVDWRKEGAVTPVKNQGQCGSCWSFSTTGSTEGAVFIATKKLESLSEQQLMDCSTAEGDHSCEGGLMDYAFEYIIKNGGIDSEADYPYVMKDEACDKVKEKHIASKINAYHDVPKNEEAQLIAAITKGPVAVAIEADQTGFQNYASGIFSGPCGTRLDHGVLAVGYTDEYIIVKNSWGATWGNAGYIYFARNQQVPNGLCGIAMSASYPEAGGVPPTPPVPPHPSPTPPPYKCTAVPVGDRADCGYTLNKTACEAKNCCYDTSNRESYKCFEPLNECLAVNPANRKDCGFGLAKTACEAKGCCYDDTKPFTYYCFFKDAPPPPGPPAPPTPPPHKSEHYEDPNAGPCHADEVSVQITGIAGHFCSPKCSATKACPTDVPTGTTAKPTCALEMNGGSTPTQCALMCKPGADAGGCPTKATCKPIQGTGVCTYDQ